MKKIIIAVLCVIQVMLATEDIFKIDTPESKEVFRKMLKELKISKIEIGIQSVPYIVSIEKEKEKENKEAIAPIEKKDKKTNKNKKEIENPEAKEIEKEITDEMKSVIKKDNNSDLLNTFIKKVSNSIFILRAPVEYTLSIKFMNKKNKVRIKSNNIKLKFEDDNHFLKIDLDSYNYKKVD